MTTEHTTRSDALMERARKYIPGGVNSPVRSWYNVGMTPRFIRSGKGPYLIDADGNEYIDYICSWGPMILGHGEETIREAVIAAAERGLSFGAPTETEVEIAQFMSERIPSAEVLRMVNSGTEAVMSAIRLARGFTGRNKIIKFAGNYHGHSDCLLVEAGSGLLTAGIPGSAGVPEGCTADTLSAEYNNAESVEKLFDANPGQIAAVIVEPVAANMGVVLPGEGFLQKLRTLCTRNQALLIFDEVITGFRLAFGGAAEYFGITPDLVTYGKIIGGGMPVGAYGGRREIMEMVSPLGPVYQAGTLSGNPVAMAAGLAQLRLLYDHKEDYALLAEKGEKLYGEMDRIIKEKGLPWQVNHIGSLGCIFFTGKAVTDYRTAKTSDTEIFARYFRCMLEHGIHLAPSQFEAMFLSLSHTGEILEKTLAAFKDAMENI
ncbi:MAG: glutamate-1-semialdehyde 2,1-aminomutase [Blautia sp.]|nr:glutamate-1-semialdehyde 2,1-aminomutase [Blautia sp.]